MRLCMNCLDIHSGSCDPRDARIAALEAERCWLLEQHDKLTVMHAERTVERDEAKRVAVWMVRQEANFFMTGKFSVGLGSTRTFYEHDGTDADIYRALREAMGAGQ